MADHHLALKLKHDFFFLALLSLGLFLILQLNWELSQYPFALDTDHHNDLADLPSFFVHSWQEFKKIYLTHNPGPYHGFLSLFLPALLTKIPQALWGKVAVVYGFKILAPLLHLISYAILCILFLQKGAARALGLLFLLALPFNTFFLFVPRTESYQLFFLSIGLLFSERQCQRWSWFFLGLASFTHLSSWVYLPFLFLLLRPRLGHLPFFGLGMILSAPQLLTPTGLLHFIQNKFFQINGDISIDSSLHFGQWLGRSVNLYTYHWSLFFILLLMLWPIFRRLTLLSVMSLASVILIFLVMFKIRIFFSGYYLQLPFTFLFLALVAWGQKSTLKLLPLAALALLCILTREEGQAYSRIGFHYSPFIKLSQQKEFQRKKNLCQIFTQSMEKRAKHLGRPVEVLLTDDYYLCPPTAHVRFVGAWAVHPFLVYQPGQNPDGLILPLERYHPQRFYFPPELQGSTQAEAGLALYRQLMPQNLGGDCLKNCLQGERLAAGAYWIHQKNPTPVQFSQF